MQLGLFCKGKESQRQRSRKVKCKCFCRVESRWGRGSGKSGYSCFSISVECCAVSRCCRGLRRITTLPAIDILQFHTVTTCRIPFCPTAAQTLGVPVIWTLERDPRELQQQDSSFFPPAGASQRPGGTADSKRLRSHSGNTETGEEDSRSTAGTPAGSNDTSDRGCPRVHRGECRGGPGVLSH